MLNIKPLSQHSLASDFLRMYKQQIKSTVYYERTSPGRMLHLRPSQLPFCAMGFFVNHGMRGMYKPMDFAMAFYTKVGSAVHEVLQDFLCQSGRLLADYHCRECGKWHRMSYKYECCGFPTKYHEIEINYKGVHGHIDAIYKDKEGRLWIVDFKTTSLKGAPYKQKNPGAAYQEQIEVYAVLVELQYGIKIAGYADQFIIRDNPMKNDPVMWCRPLTDATRQNVKRRLSRYKKMHRAALDAETKRDVLDLMQWGRCSDEWCPVCREKDDQKLRGTLMQALKMGLKRNNVPIRAMAERTQERMNRESKKR
jgi:hypothetical protein